LNEIDTAHLIEELEDMGKRDKRELKNRLEVLIMHLLKWQYQAEQRSTSWKSTIKEQREGQVRIVMLPNVQQKTIKPFIEQTISKGTLIYTDEYAIYSRLEEWGYSHKTVNHSAGEYVRDEDGDGFHEVHVNKMEGFWSLLRS
jgi:transposase-like protein